MSNNDDRWKGVDAHVTQDPCDPTRYRVEFWANYLMRPVDRDGSYGLVAGNARVFIEAEDEIRVVSYDPPGDPIPGLSREDYEGRAVHEVREYLGASQAEKPTSE